MLFPYTHSFQQENGLLQGPFTSSGSLECQHQWLHIFGVLGFRGEGGSPQNASSKLHLNFKEYTRKTANIEKKIGQKVWTFTVI